MLFSRHKKVYATHDELGAIEVIDEGGKRLLKFGTEEEQSCQLLTDPAQLQHEYTQAMMLVALFAEPRSVIILGLGAGCLATCLHQHWASSKIRGVELRPKIVDVAYKYFQLPRSKRLTTVVSDAGEYLTNKPKKADVIFTDIYHADGLDEQQLSKEYIADCSVSLKEHGWLVLNCWDDHRAGTYLLLELYPYFKDIRTCTTNTGNWLVFAGKKKDTQSAKQLREKAKQLSKQLGFSLLPPLKRMKAIGDVN